MICRPLLNVSKAFIKQYQQENDFKYYEDDSNKDSKYTRNYLRNQLLPVIEERQEFSTDHLLDLNQWMNDARKLIITAADDF